jgi:cytidylate kinase
VIVTIDGPAGSGKSTTAGAVAQQLGFRHLDSGAFYRALTRAVLDAGVPEEQWRSLQPEQLDELGVRGEPGATGYRLLIGTRDVTESLRSAAVNSRVSAIAALPAVRDWLLGRLRSAAPGMDLVADGRDMGTVVFPEAELKFFLLADAAVRAARRLLERGRDPGDPALLAAEVARIEARDHADSTRAVAPLRRPTGAIDIDTTHLSFEAQVSTIVARVRAFQAAARGVAEG